MNDIRKIEICTRVPTGADAATGFVREAALRHDADILAGRQPIRLDDGRITAMLGALPDAKKPVTAMVALLVHPAAWEPDIRRD